MCWSGVARQNSSICRRIQSGRAKLVGVVCVLSGGVYTCAIIVCGAAVRNLSESV